MLILLHNLLTGGEEILTTAGPAPTHKFGELSMNHSNYVRCRGVADGGRIVATLALFITEWVGPQKFRIFCKSQKLFSRHVYKIK